MPAGIIVDVAARKENQEPWSPQLLGKRIALARTTRGLGVNELGRMAGVDGGVISRLEAGKKPNVGMPTVAALCVALDVRLEWLVLGRGTMTEQPASSRVRPQTREG